MRRLTLAPFLVVLAVLVLSACSSSGPFDLGGEIWVANAASDDIRIYDEDFALLAMVELPGQTPHALELHPDGDELWVVNIEGNSIWIVDVETREIAARIDDDELVRAPTTLRFSEDGATAYVVGAEGFLNVIDVASRTIVSKSIAGFNPHGLVVLPDGTLRTSNRGSDDVSEVSALGVFIDHYPSGDFSYDIAASADGETLFVSARGWDAISVLRTEDHSLLGAIPVGDEPVILGLADGGRKLFVANSGDSTVSVIDTATFSVLGRDNARIGDVLSVGDQVGECEGCVQPRIPMWEGKSIAGTVARLGSAGVVLDDGGDERTVPENAFLGLKGGQTPHGLTVTPDGRFVLVAFNASDDVFVYDAATLHQIAWLHGCETEPGPSEPGCNAGANDIEIVPR